MSSATSESSVPARAKAPSRAERIPALASQVAGGPLGHFAVVGRRGWRPAAAFLSAMSSLIIALSVAQRNHCINHGWATPGSLWRYCYSDLPVAVSAPGGSQPWASPVIGTNPPLTAIVTWITRSVVPSGSQLRLQQGMFAISTVVIALCIAAAVCVMAAAIPSGPWTAAHLALSPVLFTAALTSYDAIAVLLVSLSLFFWHRQKYAFAGSAAMGAFLTRPALGVLLIALVCVASMGGQKATRGLLIGASATLAVVALPWFALASSPLLTLTTWSDQGPSYGSIWYVLELAGMGPSPETMTALALLGWLLALGLGIVLARLERVTNPAPIALALLFVVLFFSRAVPVQAALWVLPFIAASFVLWRDHLIWAAAECAYFIVVWPFVARDSNPGKALPNGWYMTFTVIRFVALAYLVRAAAMANPALLPAVPPQKVLPSPRTEPAADAPGHGGYSQNSRQM